MEIPGMGTSAFLHLRISTTTQKGKKYRPPSKKKCISPLTDPVGGLVKLTQEVWT